MSKRTSRLQARVRAYLDEEPRARERRNKDRALANLLIARYGLADRIPKDTLIALLQDYATMDRAWRKILAETPALRGSDYGDKGELESRARADLGYPIPYPYPDRA